MGKLVLPSRSLIERTLERNDLVHLAASSAGHPEASWPAILSAGGSGVLPEGDHASWLPEAFELWWSCEPPADRLDVQVELVAAPDGDPQPRATTRTSALIDGIVVAEVVMHARLRSAPDHSRSVVVEHPPPTVTSVPRIVTPEEVHTFCQALRTPSWTTSGLAWAGVYSRPQPVVPVTLLACEAISHRAPGPGSLHATVGAPVLAGAMLHWARGPEVPGRSWVLDPGREPAILFDAAGVAPYPEGTA